MLHARLHIDYICTAKSDKEIRTMVQDLPNGLEHTYQTLLCDIATRYPIRIAETKKLFWCLVTAVTPLTAREISEVIAMQPEEWDLDHDAVATDPYDALEAISPLIRIDSSENQRNVIRLCHYTLEQYLCSNTIRHSPANLFFVSAREADAWMANICLQHLTLDTFNAPLEYGLDLGLDQDYAFRQYAALNWFNHANVAQGPLQLCDPPNPYLSKFLDSGEGPPCYKRWQNLVAKKMPNAEFLDYSPICMCIIVGLDIVVRTLSQQLPTLDHHFENGLTCLTVAAKHYHQSMARYLLQCGAMVDEPTREPGHSRALTPLHFAAEWCALGVVDLLLDNGADPHKPSASGATPFYRACRGGDLDIVNKLRNCGSDINARTYGNWTPILEAIEHGHEDTLDLLLEWRADLSVVTKQGWTALSFARALKKVSMLEKLQRAVAHSGITLPDNSPESC
jgi:amino acid transporter